MKHVFTIHSPITFLMTLWVHRYLELKEEEVIVISANYKLPIPFGKVIPAFPETQTGLVKKIIHFNVGKSFDEYVRVYIGDQPFTAYVDIMHTYQKLLVTHEHCQAFHFMEEGTDSYMQAVILKDFTRTAVSEKFRVKKIKDLFKESVRAVRGYSSGLHSLPYHAQAYQYDPERKFFCLSNWCYSGVPDYQKVVVEPELQKQESKILASNMSLRNAVLIIEETYPEKYGVSKDEYGRVLRHGIGKLHNDGDKVFVKCRPGDSQKSTLLSILNDLDISFEVLPKGILAEGLFLNSQNLKVVGFVSSLLLYANLLGHKSFSLLKNLRNRPKTRFDRIAGFDRIVEFLD